MERIPSEGLQESISSFYLGILCLYFYPVAPINWGIKKAMGKPTFEDFCGMSFRFFNWLNENREVFAAYKASLGFVWA
jgi:hypothetical protein